MAAPLLELKGVSKAFGGLHVIVDLDLVVGEGEIVSLIGPNGAGKTTVFNLITGLYRPDKGEISLGG
ncbi:MAG: ATP-binding cassette domain-containing protein, partial [Actinobacteria bacterium]